MSREVSFETISVDELFPVRVELYMGVRVDDDRFEFSVSWAICS